MTTSIDETGDKKGSHHQFCNEMVKNTHFSSRMYARIAQLGERQTEDLKVT